MYPPLMVRSFVASGVLAGVRVSPIHCAVWREEACLLRFSVSSPSLTGRRGHDHLGDIANARRSRLPALASAWWCADQDAGRTIAIDGKRSSRRSARRDRRKPSTWCRPSPSRHSAWCLPARRSARSRTRSWPFPLSSTCCRRRGARHHRRDRMPARHRPADHRQGKPTAFWALKGNQGTLREDVEPSPTTCGGFSTPIWSADETVDGDHGFRIETAPRDRPPRRRLAATAARLARPQRRRRHRQHARDWRADRARDPLPSDLVGMAR